MDHTLTPNALNAELNLYGPDGKIQFDKDKEAARQYFLQHVNPNTVFFHDIFEKLKYLVENGYYEEDFLKPYSQEFIKSLYKRAYAFKFRFPTYLGAFKYYTSYTLKTFDGTRYLERFEDRVVAVALYLARGDTEFANNLVDEIIEGRYQPATPTFLNAGKKQRGEMVSCFLLRVEDNMESIGRAINSSLQLSKRGGGVGLLLTNIREHGAPIKQIENQSSGIIPIMKILEDSFSYANQLGARQGAGAVYLSAHHPDIMKFLDTKRENADEKIRIKTLSLGVVIPDVTFELAKNNEPMYLFSPYDVEREYGKPLSEISISEEYRNLVENENIKKYSINAREFFKTIAEIQFESGYPYILFEDNANRGNPIDGRINMSNLCSEILQVNSESVFNPDGSYKVVGNDISCNLGSINIAKAMESPSLGNTIHTAIRALTAVADLTSIEAVPSVKKANDEGHAIGLGQMNLAGFLGLKRIKYGSEEALDFVSTYFALVAYHAISASNQIAFETATKFAGFENSTYADGSYFTKYIEKSWAPKTDKIKKMFYWSGIHVPTQNDWRILAQKVKMFGLYHMYLQAVPPTGSISYINNSTSSVHPIASKIEIRKEGKIGRVYYPAPYMTNDNLEFYEDAYEIGYEKIIDTYAAAQEHIDQGMSLTLFFKDTATTRDLNKAYIYAWKKGIKTIYYIRIRQMALDGTDVKECVSCML